MKPPKGRVTRKLIALRKKFDAVHAKGMAALAARDFDTLTRVIDEEQQIIDEQATLMAEHWPAMAPTAKRRLRARTQRRKSRKAKPR